MSPHQSCPQTSHGALACLLTPAHAARTSARSVLRVRAQHRLADRETRAHGVARLRSGGRTLLVPRHCLHASTLLKTRRALSTRPCVRPGAVYRTARARCASAERTRGRALPVDVCGSSSPDAREDVACFWT